jgi:hypothetical protein
MFPSSLTHMVENKEGTNTRISLAFNVFIKGAIGSNKELNGTYIISEYRNKIFYSFT